MGMESQQLLEHPSTQRFIKDALKQCYEKFLACEPADKDGLAYIRQQIESFLQFENYLKMEVTNGKVAEENLKELNEPEKFRKNI